MTGNTMYCQGVLGELIAKLEARPEKNETTNQTIKELRQVRIHLLTLNNELQIKSEKLSKLELEDTRRDAALSSTIRKNRILEKELNDIKQVLYDSI